MIYIKYLTYLLRHKLWVFIYCCKLGVPWRGVTHDLSKFRLREFVPYAQWFCGLDGKNTPHSWARVNTKNRFDKAWLHHQNANSHHALYWVQRDNGKLFNLEMPIKDIKEMVADWCGAAIAQGHSIKSLGPWFAEKIKPEFMAPHTFEYARSIVTHIMVEEGEKQLSFDMRESFK